MSKRLAPPARRGPRRDAAPGLAPRLKPPPGSRSTWTLLPRIMMRCCAAQRHRAREGGSNPSKFEVRTKSFLLRLPRAYRACIISAGRANYEEPLRCAPLPLLLCIIARGTEALPPRPVIALGLMRRRASESESADTRLQSKQTLVTMASTAAYSSWYAHPTSCVRLLS